MQLWKNLMINGSIKLFMSNKVLDNYIDNISHEGFKIYTFDCSKWDSKKYHHDLAIVLGFPGYYGENLDAFNDCLLDMVEEETDFVFVFKNYELFAKQNSEAAFQLLDIIQINSWRFLIEGVKLLSFVQSNDATISFPALGAMSAVLMRVKTVARNKKEPLPVCFSSKQGSLFAFLVRKKAKCGLP